MATTPVVYDSASKRHRPLGDGETLGAGSVPVSQAADNLIETRPDGLYASGTFSADDQNAVKLSGDQTVQGSKTFTEPIRGSVTGSAARAAADANGLQIDSGYVKVADIVPVSQIDAMFA